MYGQASVDQVSARYGSCNLDIALPICVHKKHPPLKQIYGWVGHSETEHFFSESRMYVGLRL